MLEIFSIALKGAVMAVVLLAAYEDLRHLRIRNQLALVVAVLFLPMIVVLPLKVFALHLLTGVVFFAIAAAMFFARLMGGGDTKLLGALGLWIALPQVPLFLVVMSVTGGVLGVAALLLKRAAFLPRLAARFPEDGWFAALQRGERAVPYGIAIAAATAVTLF